MTFRDESSDGKKKDRKTVFGYEGGKSTGKRKKRIEGGKLEEKNTACSGILG